MAEGKGSGTPRKRVPPKPKAGAAFGRLNALSASGALTAINNGGPTAEASGQVPETAAATATVQVPVPIPAPAAQRQEATPAPVSESTPDSVSSDVTDGPGPDEEALDLRSTALDGFEESPRAHSKAAPETKNPDAPARLLHQDGHEAHSQAEEPAGRVALRRTAPPAFPSTSGYSEQRLLDALPPQLADKVDGLPIAYRELATSYRRAQATRTGTKSAKRNIRLHAEVAQAVNRQLVHDKRMLKLKNLKPSQYVDAALTLARGVSVEDLITAADGFRDSHLGEEAASGSPNHYSISKDNDTWLNDMMDELLLANTTGLHGHMINVIVRSFLEQLRFEAPAEG